MGDRVDPIAGDNAPQALEPRIQQVSDQNLRRATDFLLDNIRIANFRSHYDKYRRYVTLQTTSMFGQLVTLYSSMFNSQWQHFRRLMDCFPPPQGVNPHTHAARIYVSTWFHDLYCTIREATRAISALAFNERYSQEEIAYSNEYDSYLSLLSASIKPTHIKLTSEDTLYIPLLADNINWNNLENPFGITSYIINLEAFYGITQIMKERKHWNMQQVPTTTMGRPCWLFDWHDNNNVCAWFPRQDNYNDNDVTLAYIIGVACTPKLGPRDTDEWQFALNAQFPNAQNLTDADRIRPRIFHGSYEVKTIESEAAYTLPHEICDAIDNQIGAATQRRKVRRPRSTGTSLLTAGASGSSTPAATETPTPTTEETEVEIVLPNFPRYRIIDWCYYSRVILNFEWHTRTGALKTISLN
ncbi:ORF1 [Panax cryptic virus 1]|nr:ORF1 [Panax cryptic virus 1]QED42882.1 ORF1 [Panax cryptic virus 1]